MGAAQYILIAIISLNLLLSFLNDGKPKKVTTYDFKGNLIAAIIMFGLLIWGGFFK